MNLRVTMPFGDYAVGDLITDPTKVAEILAADTHRYVVRVAASPPPAPPSVPAPAIQAVPPAPAA